MKAWAGTEEGCGRRWPTSGKFWKIFGQNPFWFVLGKKMCTYYGLLWVRDIAVTPTTNIGVI